MLCRRVERFLRRVKRVAPAMARIRAYMQRGMRSLCAPRSALGAAGEVVKNPDNSLPAVSRAVSSVHGSPKYT